MGRFEGKAALVTGGSSGIGLATAKLLQREGARVVVTGRTEKALDSARLELGEKALVFASDTSNLAAIDALVKDVRSSFGSLDLLFINAGIAKVLPFEQVTETFYDEILDINTKGAFFTVQKFVPLINAGGAVVLNTSIADETGVPSLAVYSASKAALRSMARTLAAELLPKGIRVNAVSPGPITTLIFAKLGLASEERAGFETTMREGNPMKRFGTAEEVAKAVLFLAADATYTTGAELPVDGGLTQL